MEMDLEEQALVPVSVKRGGFDEHCHLPYDLTVDHRLIWASSVTI